MNLIIKSRKYIRIAVIGYPSSGKSYLVSDMITSLKYLGFIPEKLPLSYPHNSLGGFFNDVYINGGMEQTGRKACRSTDHYGAYLVHQRSGRRIGLDFLNIPGETFSDAEKQLLRYGSLVRSLQVVSKGLFNVSTWKNPSGMICYLLEPSEKVRRHLSLPQREIFEKNHLDVCDSKFIEIRQHEYHLTWAPIYSEMNYGLYKRITTKPVTGKYLLNHFFDFNTDSVFATLCDVWNAFAPDLSKDEYILEHAFHAFYYLHYSFNATDLIVCDKLFLKDKNISVSKTQENFLKMIGILVGLFPPDKVHPQTYLAFRGTDLMMSKYSAIYQKKFANGSAEERCDKSYEAFMTQFKKLVESGGDVSSLKCFDDDLLIDPIPAGYQIPTGGDIVAHIKSRIGGDNAHGFRTLLQTSGMERKRLQLHEIIPPHVFFTATPIDTDFRFYFNDPINVTRFIYQENDINKKRLCERTRYAFHVELAKHRTSNLCFGTRQLLKCIMNNNGIKIK